MRKLIAILLGCWITFGVARAQAADQEPGILLRWLVHTGNEGGARPIYQAGRSIAIYVPSSVPLVTQSGGQGLIGFGVTATRFNLQFTGNLNQRLRSYVRFHAEGAGHFTLTMNGVKVLDATGDDLSHTVSEEVRLNKGANAFLAEYESPSKGDAAIRLFWESKSFATEPVPAALLTHDQPKPDIAPNITAVEGPSLVAQYRCLKCHTTIAGFGGLAQPVPDFNRDAPGLADTGSRLQFDWLAAWIADPQKLRPGAHMPAMLHGEDAPKVTSDIAAYLMSLGKLAALPKNAGDATAGGRLFANLECVVCHTPLGADEDASRITLKYVAAKFQPAALQQYLLDPAAHYAWNPMPKFGLSETEAADLSAYLSTGAEAPPKAASGDAIAGKAQFVSAGCATCHPGAEKAGASKPISLAMTTDKNGCLAEIPDPKSPRFAFTADQRQLLTTAIHYSYGQRCDAELAEGAIHELRCMACHSRDATESLLSQSLAEASQALHQQFPNPAAGAGELLAAEQRIPSLTFAGEKLRPEWTEQFIGGKLNYKPRYFLRARMPAFGAWAGTLARGMAEQHGVAPNLPEVAKPKANLVEAGRALCGKTANVGFSCNQCHPIGNVAPFAPFEAPSINFQYVAERLRPQYYNRWMHDPARIDVATKMPKFADADNKTGLATFDHDAGKQFDAMWQYLLTGRNIQPPK